jgi:hypothetical protein
LTRRILNLSKHVNSPNHNIVALPRGLNLKHTDLIKDLPLFNHLPTSNKQPGNLSSACILTTTSNATNHSSSRSITCGIPHNALRNHTNISNGNLLYNPTSAHRIQAFTNNNLICTNHSKHGKANSPSLIVREGTNHFNHILHHSRPKSIPLSIKTIVLLNP